MTCVLDLHLHSKYSRACSAQLELAQIEKACRLKGIDVISTSDFTHPRWFAHLQENLEAIGDSGFYKLKNSDGQVKFILGTEIASIYKRDGKTRRIHTCFYLPSLESVARLNESLRNAGYNLSADGRPIIGLDVRDLAEIFYKIDERMQIIPAHIWTPWFAMLGSKSGFDSVEECWGDWADKIAALETGLSSDPAMNWRCSFLDKYSLVSNSDAHSLQNLAREANVFAETPASYDELFQILKTKDKSKFLYTLEFYPEEGMYHYDGHRDCGVVFSPEESQRQQNLCPKCNRALTLGVAHRVADLADRPEGFVLENAPSFRHLLELDKIIADVLGVKSRTGKKVRMYYDQLLKHGKNELNLLLLESVENLAAWSTPSIAEGINKVRQGKVKLSAGYDGEYGKVEIC
jgi:uncharacterized protein (TIGR00375 family)